ncbi:MAG: MRP family ATP-binding protein [Acidobacteria bacterium]|jgi:ATP-binding protein involved in chromosome partitioning|nr:MAG: MRP family ATP-binding protein [Acidobacteriota bacterium]GIU81473.1 MAG: iron-sulfur cluster carrier protein [Pyrinomonadaceae bacterium]
MSQVTQEKVLETLRQIIDPDLRKDIVSLGFVRDLKVEDGEVSFRIVLTTPACPVKDEMAKQAKQLVSEIEGVKSVNVTMDAEVPKGRGMSNSDIENIKNIIAVSSGKGGVGKSTVAVNLAVSLALDGAKVGLMDADIYGPNVPIMLGVKNFKPYISDRKLVPVEAHGVKMISMALLASPDQAMIMRGPMLHGVVRQFLSEVAWGELDYLIVDMPPGTGDVQLSLAQLVSLQGAVLVTTPQTVSTADVRRALKMFETVNVPILGIVENMSYFIPPDAPEKRYYIFGQGGGKKLAEEFNVPFLGEIPLGMEVREASDNGVPIAISNPGSPQAQAFRKVSEEIARQVSIEAMKPELVILTRSK